MFNGVIDGEYEVQYGSINCNTERKKRNKTWKAFIHEMRSKRAFIQFVFECIAYFYSVNHRACYKHSHPY